MKKVIKNRFSKIGKFMARNMLGFIIGGVVFGAAGVSAAILMSASEISYKDTTVQEALVKPH